MTRYGKKDMDSLYDFEKYLDSYGNNNTNSQKYNSNDPKSNGDVIGIYHSFDPSSTNTGNHSD